MIAGTAPASRPLSPPPPTLLQLLRRVPLAYTDSRSWRALAHVLTGGPVAIVAAALVCLGAASGGLRGLGGRVAALDGWFQVSSPAGGPTVVRAEIPCAS
jgi:hypothetical protein